jgi:hypothetical protein
MSAIAYPTPGAMLALWRLLVVVMGTAAPAAPVLAAWPAYDRALVRRWAERELARKTVGAEGAPALRLPEVLQRFHPVARAGAQAET